VIAVEWESATPTSFTHEPVLLREVLALLAAPCPRTIVDCTVGGAGHAQALLAAFPRARLIGLDRDPEAIAAASERLASFGARARLVHARFSELRDVIAGLGIDSVDVILADLGVSSHQLDAAARGFSFRHDGPLDMRMDQSHGVPVAELLADLDLGQLARLLATLGEERRARRVARAILAERPTTTGALAALVRRVVSPDASGNDPATRTFQALRLFVNDELGELATLLAAAPDLLAEDGVLAVVSFHSLEDRAVKQAIQREVQGCICPPRLPACACGRVPTLRPLTKKPIRPRPDELLRNPRAQSARLRAARRLPRVT
jgi:16S rRNA (cytosine1402-N4)-methyltransferase